MDLNNNDLYKKHDQLIELKRQTYEKLYTRCKNRIKLTSDASELICLFEIPNFLFGSSYPIINIQSCANYIMNKLTSANKHIKTTFVEPNILFIDWRRDCDINNTNQILKQKKHKLDSSRKSNPSTSLVSSLSTPSASSSSSEQRKKLMKTK
jgi:hypothetical protein